MTGNDCRGIKHTHHIRRLSSTLEKREPDEDRRRREERRRRERERERETVERTRERPFLSNRIGLSL